MPDSTLIKIRIRNSVRAVAVIAIIIAIGLFIGDTEATRVLFVASQAVFATTAIATLAQWAFTAINFTEQKCKQYEDNLDEIIVGARIRTLGMIYIGVSIVVGLVYFATYRGIF
jgi:hypothetical protein